MARKETINVYTHPLLAKRFREVAKVYDGRLGMCLSAAMLMFLESYPQVQGQYLTRVFEAQVKDEVDEMLALARAEQGRRVAAREQPARGGRGGTR